MTTSEQPLFKTNRIFFCLCIVASLILLVCNNAFGDSWDDPDIYWHYSDNKIFALKVIPTGWSQKEISTNTEAKETGYGVRNEDNVPKEIRATSKDVNLTKCTVRLYKKGEDDLYVQISEIALINKILPAEVIIAANGRYIATFDNWGSYGYGDDVVVIYNEKGDLLFKYSLEDLLSKDEIREKVNQTVSSRIWMQGTALFDEKEDMLILTARSGRLAISLKDGKIIGKNR